MGWLAVSPLGHRIREPSPKSLCEFGGLLVIFTTTCIDRNGPNTLGPIGHQEVDEEINEFVSIALAPELRVDPPPRGCNRAAGRRGNRDRQVSLFMHERIEERLVGVPGSRRTVVPLMLGRGEFRIEMLKLLRGKLILRHES